MMTIRPAGERGRTRWDWLDSRHTFSFGEYSDPAHMGFRTLRVINDDRVKPGAGFAEHGHRDMEILTVVLDGALRHKDSTGASGVIRPGEVQRMTAGTGIRHSEYNDSRVEPVHFLQVWILPATQGLAPGYEQKTFDEEARRDRLALLASPGGHDGSLTLHQDALVYGATLAPGREVTHALRPGRAAWVHVARGAAVVNGRTLQAGDGAAIEGEPAVAVAGARAERRPPPQDPDGGEILLFDLA
jgi:hypothetical protein